jgi:hypothetical protein
VRSAADLDPGVAEREPDIRPAVAAEPRPGHAAAEPVVDGKVRLRVVG